MPRSWTLLALPVFLALCLHPSQARPLGQIPFWSHSSKPCPTVHFERLVVHGDSFSDNGNVYELSNHSWPGDVFYYKGRFSNGPVASGLGTKLENYAYGSATTDSEIVQGKTGINADLPVPGFIQQIQLFRNNQKTASENDLSTTLFMISFQGNDFWFDPTIDTQVVLGSIERGVRQLVDLGAQHIMVVENLDIGLIPAFGDNSTLAKERSELSAKQHREYQEMKKRLEAEYGAPKGGQPFVNCGTGVNIAFFDLFEFLKGFRDSDNLGRLGITNVTHGCVSADYQTRCGEASGYFFYDSFHPSAKVHRAIGEAVLEFMM
ncbi:hypothetical protein CPB97_010420 [Podila verticillata]|nr:hypothetical protein CPB97_010420 [Podila verticillata]